MSPQEPTFPEMVAVGDLLKQRGEGVCWSSACHTCVDEEPTGLGAREAAPGADVEQSFTATENI